MLSNLLPWRRNKAHEVAREDRTAAVTSLQRRMNELFDNIFNDFNNQLFPSNRWIGELDGIAPKLDVAVNKDTLQVTAELPGMDEKDIEVLIDDNNLLTIKGEKKAEIEGRGNSYYLAERRYGSFSRSLSIPAGFDREKVKAVFKKGVLSLTLPKADEAKSPQKKIEIKTE